MPTLTVKTLHAGYEPLPGYVLEEVLGRGGFGEVWRCSAPGDMKKAIKFVFGNQDESRARRELKSLMRIKGVRHPFLLTLERFETIDDQLVIITELADESLEDVYNRHKANGSCGIPRETLIGHLRDAADGLDYLHRSYQLQHLDIKPGNLLMIGGHVKVADFGLLKDLRDVEKSVVGGLTPIYAPPEVFDGRPSMNSDQYSLAVMYQELLTGSRPFNGRTIAQLATQHVHSAPNLEPLPASDRVVAARALEKDPSRRFGSCLEFVEALIDCRNRKSFPGALPSTLEQEQETAADVEHLPQLNGNDQLDSRNPSSHAVGVQDVLVVALGGVGAECVRELRRKVADVRIASPLNLHSVLIDTDVESISTMRLAEASERIPKCTTIYTPLKTPHEYRESGTDTLKTISRRWIYNVPRSLATEGMRPLGRLALVDHGRKVLTELKQAIDQVAQATGGRCPLVYIVGSIAGGTGSGIYVDVAHLLRHTLDKSNFADARILSLLAAAPVSGNPNHPLALHSSRAAMSEIAHFMQAGNGYPGDAGAGWPSVPAARTPLKDVYVIADNAQDRKQPRPVDTICEYLWSDATGCKELLSSAREVAQEKQRTVGQASFRSVGVLSLGNGHSLEQRLLGPSLIRQVMLQWIGAPNAGKDTAEQTVHRLMRRVGLSTDTIFKQIKTHLEAKNLNVASLKRPGQNGEQHSAHLVATAKELAGGEAMDWMSESWINNLRREISLGLTDRRIDLATAIASLGMVRNEVIQLQQKVCKTIPVKKIESDPTCVATDYEFVAFTSCLVVHKQIEKLSNKLDFLADRIERLATIVAIAIRETKAELNGDCPWKTMPDEIQAIQEDLVTELHLSSVHGTIISPINDNAANLDAKTLTTDLTRSAVELLIPIVTQYSEKIVARARRSSVVRLTATTEMNLALEDATANIERTQLISGVTPTESPELTIESALKMVKPQLLSVGGAQRLILVIGNEVERARLEPELRAAFDGPITVAIISGSDPKLIHEGQQIEVKSLLARLSVLAGDSKQLASRLSTRTDVEW